MAHGGGWIAGLVKAVPSGDTVLVMGNTGQVRADPAIGATSGIVEPPRFRPVASARRLDRARGLDDRATRAVPALGANSTDRARPSNLAGWTSPREDNHPRVAHRPTHGTSRRLEIRRVVGSTCAARRDQHLRSPSRNPQPPRDARDTAAAFFLEESTRTPSRASRPQARRTAARPRAPRQPPFPISPVPGSASACLRLLDRSRRSDRSEVARGRQPSQMRARGDLQIVRHPPDPAQHVRSPPGPHLFIPETLTTHPLFSSPPPHITGPPR